GIPQFSIYKDEKVLSTGDFSHKEARDLTDAEKANQLPRNSETFKAYLNRSIEFYKKLTNNGYDLSKIILESLGIFSNSNFNVTPNLNYKPVVADSNILIAGTANSPWGNPIFTGLVIKKIVLSLDFAKAVQPSILYGAGRFANLDTCIIKPNYKESKDESDENKYYNSHELIKVDGLNPGDSFTKSNVARYFQISNKKNAKKNLLIFVGHGEPKGAPPWFEENPLVPEHLMAFTKSSAATNILVSGNCFGGVMAKAVSCGFMAAPPNKPASGCWEKAEEGDKIPDYMSQFFAGINRKENDYDKNGKVSFAEAHAYATIKASQYNRENDTVLDDPYTKLDDLANTYFKKNKNQLPLKIQLKYIERNLMAKFATADERAVIESLSYKINVNKNILLQPMTQQISTQD
ncbi:MAG: hypothetical protein ABL927_13740, partial [Bdellovibrionales bacterium]